MKKLVFFLALIGGVYCFNPGLFYELMHSDVIEANDEVVIFTYRGCNVPCDRAVVLLQEKNMPFANHDRRHPTFTPVSSAAQVAML